MEVVGSGPRGGGQWQGTLPPTLAMLRAVPSALIEEVGHGRANGQMLVWVRGRL